ncbi:MAG: hypothetical protein AABY13_04065 [Nanoarchaeota archaeon]
MLEFLRRLFRTPPEPVTATLTRDELRGWLDAERRRRQDAIAAALNDWLPEWKRAVRGSQDAIDTLTNAELSNQKVPEKHKQFMEGNRREFLRRVSTFIETLEPPSGADEIPSFIEHWNKESAVLVKGIGRPSSILNEFFEADVRAVQRSLAALEGLCKTLEGQREAQSLSIIARLTTMLDARDDTAKKTRALEGSRAALEGQVTLATQRRVTLNDNIRTTEASPDHAAVMTLRDKLIATQDEFRAIKTRIVTVLQDLNDALPRYARISPHAKFIALLDASPLEVIMERGPVLLDVIADIRHSVEKGTIELKDKKREKVLHACTLVSAQWIDTARQDLVRAREQERALLSQISATGVVEKLALLRREAEGNDETIKRLQDELAEAGAKMGRVDLASYDQEFIKAARELGVTITLV